MREVIFDGQYYYLFRSLNSANKTDLRNGIRDIRTNSIRYFEKNGTWGKYSTESQLSLEELYNHVKIMYRRATNCNSLSNDANVVLTYHTEDPKYVVVRYTPEEYKQNVIDAGAYFLENISSRITEMEKSITEDGIRDLLKSIDDTTTREDIIKLIRSKIKDVSIAGLTERQYLDEEEGLKVAKVIGKLRVLENVGAAEQIIPEVDNSRLIGTMGNAFTSSEFINYGTIPSSQVIDIPKEIIDVIAILQQARLNTDKPQVVNDIILYFINLAEEGYSIDKDTKTFSNGVDSIEIEPKYLEFLYREYYSNFDFQKEISIQRLNSIFRLSNGSLSYNDSRIQLLAIFEIAEAILKTRALINLIQNATGEKDIEETLGNVCSINPKRVIKQNNRGLQLSSTVNLLINYFGYDLDDDVTRTILEKLNALSSEELVELLEKGLSFEKLPELLSFEKKDGIPRRIGAEYFSHAIVEGYDWTQTRRLMPQEKSLLINKMYYKGVAIKRYRYLYQAIEKALDMDKKPTQEEVFAAIMNIVVDGELEGIPYKNILLMPPQEMEELLSRSSDSLRTLVDDFTIDLAIGRGRALTQMKNNLVALGLDRDFINTKRIHNIYMAQKIVESYYFDREITPNEKKAIIYCILDTTALDEDKHFYLSTFLKNLEDIGLAEQDAYGAIISLAIRRKSMVPQISQSYAQLIKSRRSCMQLEKYKDYIETSVSNGDIENAVIKESSRDASILQEYIDMGFEEFAQSINVQNLVYAKKIVDEYDFGRQLTAEERRAVIYCLLNNSKLSKSAGSLISGMVGNFERLGLNLQQCYGAVLNLAINGKVIDQTGYGYNTLTGNKSKFADLAKYKKLLFTNVNDSLISSSTLRYNYAKKRIPNETMILSAQEQSLNAEQKERIIAELISWGMDKKLVDRVLEENLFIAKKIIEGYQFDRQLSNVEKCSIIRCMIDNSAIGEKKAQNYHLITLCLNLASIGLGTQEIYGTIMNAAINNLNYSGLLTSISASEELAEHKDEIQTKVSEFSIQKAVANNIRIAEDTSIIDELTGLGMTEKFLESKEYDNMYMSKYIVDSCNYGRALSDRERGALIRCILNVSFMGNKNGNDIRHLYNTIQNFEDSGFSEQETFSTIINLAVKKYITDETGYSYTAILAYKKKVEELYGLKDKIQFEVSEETIRQAVGDPIVTMKKTVSKAKSKGYLTSLYSIRTDLDMLVRNERKSSKKEQEGYRFSYVDENGTNYMYSPNAVKIIFGIDPDIIRSFYENVDTKEIELTKLIEYYNQSHHDKSINLQEKMNIFRQIGDTRYSTVNENGDSIQVDFDELYQLIKKRHPKIRQEAVYVYLRNMHEDGYYQYDDIVAEIGRRYEAVKANSYTYLYPNEEGELVETSLNAILIEYKKKHPGQKLSFDTAKKYIELAISEGARPEEAVEKGIELYNQRDRKTSQFLLLNEETGKYQKATASKIKRTWRSFGVEVSKDETVLKFLKLAEQIPGIKSEEVVSKAFDMVRENIPKYDFMIDSNGTIKKMTINAIATRISTPEHKIAGTKLKKIFEQLKETMTEVGLTDAELMNIAVERAQKSGQIKYPFMDSEGKLKNLTITEIARITDLNRQTLTEKVKKLGKNENLTKGEIITQAIETLRAKKRTSSRKESNNATSNIEASEVDDIGKEDESL